MTKEAEDAWIELLLSGPGMMLGSPTARPATTTTRAKTRAGAPAASSAIRRAPWRTSQYIDQWRTSGEFDGLEFR